MKEYARKTALAGIIASLVFLIGMTPVGLIPLGSINLTIMHIPVIIITLLLGVKTGAAAGFALGLASMLAAFNKSLAKQTVFASLLLPHSSFAVFLTAVVPALVLPVATNYIYLKLLKLNRTNQYRRKRLTKSTIISYAAIGGSLAYTLAFAILMGASLAFANKGADFANTFFSFPMFICIAIEAAAAAFISAPIVRTITDYNESVIKSKKPKPEEIEEIEENEDLRDVAVMPTTESLLPYMNEKTANMHSKCMGFFNSGAYDFAVKMFDKFEEEFADVTERFNAKLYVIMRFIEVYQYKIAEKRLVEALKFAQGIVIDDKSTNVLTGIIKILRIANANTVISGKLDAQTERIYAKAIDFVNSGAYLLAAQMLERL
ncbi:MAG TPA: ECF transporter S component [Clostridiales bacterium]|jgi:uncharacterized membrane protein|nr:ECF transporter S component [Clostridiales bacterium]